MAKNRPAIQPSQWPRQWLIGLIRCYQWCISPLLGNRCRFYPTCSHYAVAVIQQQGIFNGSVLTLKRVLKCHPWHPGGIDLPPESRCFSSTHNHGNH